MTAPRWATFLRNWPRKPSFSYLIGALVHPIGATFQSKTDALSFARRLYDEIAKPPEGIKVSSHDCDGVGGLVLTTRGEGLGLASFTELWSECEADVYNGLYSRWKGVPSRIPDTDKDAIRRALGEMDE